MSIQGPITDELDSRGAFVPHVSQVTECAAGFGNPRTR